MGAVVVTAHGHLDVSSAAVLTAVLSDLLEGQGNLRVFVDLHDMTVADASGLADLVASAATAARLGGELTFADPCETVAAALEAAGLGSRAGTNHTRLRALVPPANGQMDECARRTAMAEHPAGQPEQEAGSRPHPLRR
jgi:anti-anti-sigma factor